MIKSVSKFNSANSVLLHDMGETRVRVKLYGIRGWKEIEALVDTGATFTKVQESVAREIGVDLKYDTTVEMEDKRLVQRKLGLAEIEFDWIRRPVLVAVSPDTEEPLIGYTTLENLELKVNPVTRKLEKTKPIEYR